MVVELFIVLLLFLIGASVGSFLNVLVMRFITRESVIAARSRCPHCQKVLRWYELVPICSFIFLQGRCASCRATIAAQYPIVEFVTGVAFLSFLLPVDEFWWRNFIAFIIFCLLVVLFLVDLKTFLLPDVYIMALTFTVLSLYALGYIDLSLETAWATVAGSGFLLVLWAATSGQGLGLGDVKLMIPLGLLFGLAGVVALLFSAFVAGGLVGIYLLLAKKASAKTPIPFGPFLTGIAMLFLLWPSLPHTLWQFILPL